MKKKLEIFIFIVVLIIGLGYFANIYFNNQKDSKPKLSGIVTDALAADFDYLSKNGNSNCSKAFIDSIASMSDEEMVRGSCCGKMNMHVYSEQREGLKKYSNIAEIPSDPYNIKAGLAKKMIAYYSTELSPDEQKAYDFAMQNSSNKGPCCCKCWRWQFYGGLAKYLIKNYQFNGQQITEVWNLSDGCGGEADHVYHSNK